MCILTPEILDTVYVRGRLPRTIDLSVVLRYSYYPLQLTALVPFSFFFLLSVSQSTVKLPLEFFSFCFYHIINTFTITLSSSLAHMQPGGHTLPYASDVFQNVITTLARYTYFCLAIQLSLLTRVCIFFTALAGFTQRFIGAVAVSLPTSASARSSFTRAKFISFL